MWKARFLILSAIQCWETSCCIRIIHAPLASSWPLTCTVFTFGSSQNNRLKGEQNFKGGLIICSQGEHIKAKTWLSWSPWKHLGGPNLTWQSHSARYSGNRWEFVSEGKVRSITVKGETMTTVFSLWWCFIQFVVKCKSSIPVVGFRSQCVTASVWLYNFLDRALQLGYSDNELANDHLCASI